VPWAESVTVFLFVVIREDANDLRLTDRLDTKTPVRWGTGVWLKNLESLLTLPYARVRFRLRKYLIGSHVRWSRRQHLFFAINQIAGVEACQLKSMAMRNRIGWASFDTVAAKDTSVVIDVVDVGVAFGA